MRGNFPENHSFSQFGHIGMNVNYTQLMKISRIGSSWPESVPELDFGSGGYTSAATLLPIIEFSNISFIKVIRGDLG